jgi:hypothetical protein
MHAVTLGLSPTFDFRDMTASSPSAGAYPPSAGAYPPSAGQMMDPDQLQQLMQLLGGQQAAEAAPGPAAAAAATAAPKQTAVVECPKSMVGRVIGKGGETIKALQQYTGAMIQIDQSTDPTRVTIAGSPQSLQLAVSMVHDIVRGTFKGFAMLRQIAIATSAQAMGQFGQPQPVYVQGYGFVPPSQVFNPEDTMAASLMRASPTGPLTPPMTPLRAPAAGGALQQDQLAALLGAAGGGQYPPPPPPQAAQHQQQQAPGAGGAQGERPCRVHHARLPRHSLLPRRGAADVPAPRAPPPPAAETLIAQLLQQLSMQGGAPPPPPAAPAPPQHEPALSAGLDQAAIQTLLAQAGLMGAGQAAAANPSANASAGLARSLPPPPGQHLPSTSLMLSAQGTPAVLGAAGQPAFRGLGAAAAPRSSGAASPMHSVGGAAQGPGGPLAGFSSPLSYLGGGPGGAGSFFGTSPAGASPRDAAPAGRGSPTFAGLASAPNAAALSSRRSASGESSPLGRYGAIGTGMGGAPRAGSAASAEGGRSAASSREASPPRQPQD